MADSKNSNIWSAIENEKASQKERVEPLIELLKSNTPLNSHVKGLIIDLIDPDSPYPFYMQLKRRFPGKIPDPYIYSKEHYIGWTIFDGVRGGAKVESVVAAACAQYKCTRSYAYSAYRSYCEWWDADLASMKAGKPRAMHLYWAPTRKRSSKNPARGKSTKKPE